MMKAQKKRVKSRLLKEHLVEQMSQHTIPLGGRLPSETTLMQRFSLSRSTVRKVLYELSVEGLVDRQQGRGTFRSSGFITRRATSRSMLVGVWFNAPSGPLFGDIAEGVREELRAFGYHGVFEVGGLEPGAEYRGIESLARKGLDGFIVSPSTNLQDDHGPLIRLIHDQVPLVLVDRQLPGYETDLVCTDNELGAEELVLHLIGLGHRRIGYIGIEGFSTMEDRLRGYRRVMQQHGLPIEPAWVVNDRQANREWRRAATRELLSLTPENRPTALFGAMDYIASDIVTVAADLGLAVPADLSVVGFDDINVDPAKRPWLTTYAQPKQRIGRQAVRALMRRIQNSTARNVTVLLEGRLVQRSSTAPPAGLALTTAARIDQMPGMHPAP